MLLWRDMRPLPYLSVLATISSTFERTYWSRFLLLMLRYVFQHHLTHLMLLHPILTIISQFEKVGSQAAGEPMEEHVETERVETDRASPSQHAETVRGESSSGITLGDISLLDRSMYHWAPAVQTPIE